LKILVIEDVQLLLDQITAILEEEGYQVLGTKDGAGAVFMTELSPPDLVLCDINLPGMNGFELLEWYRSNQRTAGIPFIMLTGRATREDLRKSMTLGADDFVTKPFTGRELLASIKARLSRQQAIRATPPGGVRAAASKSDLDTEPGSVRSALALAIERDEFSLAYQPKIRLRDGVIVGVEALLRWDSPALGGPVTPSQFIPVAESCGLIRPVGEWVLERSLIDALAWRAAGYDLHVAVNVSPKQWDEENFEEKIFTVMDRLGFPPMALYLEVTESCAMAQPNEAARRMDQLRERGIRMSLDDFGTGFSNLALLKKLPIDELKLDRSFVDGLPDESVIPRAVVTMGRDLGLHVVAEGVETTEQLGWVRAAGCDGAQGFLFARPMPGADIMKLLRAKNTFLEGESSLRPNP
jgi:EAL domain-containing protein (putative c-di-GMP-specific phosphodiesterase class I)/CheY-like chemotaxis protein